MDEVRLHQRPVECDDLGHIRHATDKDCRRNGLFQTFHLLQQTQYMGFLFFNYRVPEAVSLFVSVRPRVSTLLASGMNPYPWLSESAARF